jgi:DNA-binding SARP family transcriptional activator
VWSEARRRLRTKLLSIIEHRDERTVRMAHLRELEAERMTADLAVHKSIFLADMLEADELISLIDEWAPRLDRLGLARSAAQFRVLRATTRLGIGGTLDAVCAEIERCIDEARESVRARMRSAARAQLAIRCILIGDEHRYDAITDGFEKSEFEWEAYVRVCNAASDRGVIDADALVDAASTNAFLVALARAVCDDRVVEGHTLVPLVRVHVADDPSPMRALITLHVALAIIGSRDIEASFRSSLRGAVLDALVLLEERRVPAFIMALVERAHTVLTKREAEMWRAAARRLQRERARDSDEGDALVRVTVLGTMAVHRDGAGEVALRGARVRTLMGLIVVAELLGRQFGRGELAALASGEEEDRDAARRALNGIVLRLRDVLGAESVVTDGDVPHLHASVRVDLLDAQRNATDAVDACTRGELSRAFGAALALFMTLEHGVPFPGLYESIFESAREQIEATARTCAIVVARALLIAGDHAGCAELLERAVRVLPGDDELAELLAETLRRDGRPLEALRAGAEALTGWFQWRDFVS